MPQINFDLDPFTHRDVIEVATQMGLTIHEVARRAVLSYLTAFDAIEVNGGQLLDGTGPGTSYLEDVAAVEAATRDITDHLQGPSSLAEPRAAVDASDQAATQELPSRLQYLKAGLPHLGDSTRRVFGSIRSRVGTTADVLDAIDVVSEISHNSRSMTVMNPRGEIAAVVWLPSRQFLAAPYEERWPPYPNSVLNGRTQAGHARFTMSGRRDPYALGFMQRSDFDMAGTDPVCTIDTSVLMEGLDATKFKPRELFFVSDALVQEVSVASLIDETGSTSTVFSHWNLCEPVPMDSEIILMSREMWGRRDGRRSPTQESALSSVDVMCAATAAIYGVPLYTTRPEEYKKLGRRVKTITYGPPRSKSKT